MNHNSLFVSPCPFSTPRGFSVLVTVSLSAARLPLKSARVVFVAAIAQRRAREDPGCWRALTCLTKRPVTLVTHVFEAFTAAHRKRMSERLLCYFRAEAEQEGVGSSLRYFRAEASLLY